MGKIQLDHPASNIPSIAIANQEISITLKVPIHCEGCKRKVKRVIDCVDGVESIYIEAADGKVTVVGKSVDVGEVLRVLHKAGKRAEVLHSVGYKAPHTILPINSNNDNIPNMINNTNKFDNKHVFNIENNNGGSKGDGVDIINGADKKPGWNNDGASSKTEWEKFIAEKTLNRGKGDTGLPMARGVALPDLGKKLSGEVSNMAMLNPPFATGGNKMSGEVSNMPMLNPPFVTGGNKMSGEVSNMAMLNPPFVTGGSRQAERLDQPSLLYSDAAIVSKNVAPMSSAYYSKTSQSPHEKSVYSSVEYATNLFSDENANNCSVM
ncbi:hypothetical protein KP509_32G005700 [Ceratopteris richardii]|uniref:HMA domain-containing protein n=1 Tax=Ceratopteris richardii TaxID=49495 RepID=A0A8T2QR18_CERRI|nr:hypothetical protein KP509_32G005700 [Ceratopteris richardii]